MPQGKDDVERAPDVRKMLPCRRCGRMIDAPQWAVAIECGSWVNGCRPRSGGVVASGPIVEGTPEKEQDNDR